jgi:chromate reductase, NAD(P)H dehydrogenase (quinone)
MKDRFSILAISGSLRPTSSNNVILKIIASRMIPAGIDFVIYDGLSGIPPFNDIDNPAVDNFRKRIAGSDGILICTPEYAFGVSGVLKNALDWTVASGDFYGKKTALITASSSGEKAHASLLQTLGALSADMVPEATLLISFIRSKLNDKGDISDPATYTAIEAVVNSLIHSIRNVDREAK